VTEGKNGRLKMKELQNKRFNMQGYLIEFNNQTHGWTWIKWEYRKDWEGKKQVIRRSGSLEFMKIFPKLLSVQGSIVSHKNISNQEQLDSELRKNGVDFIFLHQGNTLEERSFKTIADAEKYYGLESQPLWNLTEYWFSYDWEMQSWAMYDAFTGELKFTPATAIKQLSGPPGTPVSHQQPDHTTGSLNTVH
jgi:hypothetical protein